MPLELWMLFALVAAAAVVGVVIRLRRKRVREAAAQSGTESKVYPLW